MDALISPYAWLKMILDRVALELVSDRRSIQYPEHGLWLGSLDIQIDRLKQTWIL